MSEADKPKMNYADRWIELRDSVINVFSEDWKPPFQPRIKTQIIKDSPLSQIVFEAYNQEVPKNSKVLAYIKLLNGNFKTLAAVALITQQRATGMDMSKIIGDMVEELRARDPTLVALCGHCGKDILSKPPTISQRPSWQR